MENISKTMPISILVKPSIIENIMIGADCSLVEVQTYIALFQEWNHLSAEGKGEELRDEHSIFSLFPYGWAVRTSPLPPLLGGSGFVPNPLPKNWGAKPRQNRQKESKEFHNVFAWSYEEMPGIDPRIVEHEIKTYDYTKPVWQKLRPVNPKKSVAIKVEVEKLSKNGLISPVPLTE